MDIGKLISSVHKRPAIWDKRLKVHRNVLHVDRCWKEIAQELGKDDTTLRKKWKYMRDYFAIEYGKRSMNKSKESANIFPQPKWQHFNSLLFLKDVVPPRAMPGSSKSIPGSPSTDMDHSDYYAEDVDLELDIDEDIKPNFSNTDGISLSSDVNDQQRGQSQAEFKRSGTSSQPKLKRKKGDDYYEKLLEIEEKKVQYLFNKRKRTIINEDPDLMFYKSLLPHVKLIPQEKKLKFQTQIQAVVQDFAYPTLKLPSHSQAQNSYQVYCSHPNASPSPTSSPVNLESHEHL